MRDLSPKGSFAASANEGIDLVNDPVILEEKSEERSEQPEHPAPVPPGGPESGMLHWKVQEIGGAVADIRQQRHDEEEKQGSERECRAEVRPGQCEPSDNDDGEGKIVEDAAEFPKPDGIGEKGAKRRRWRRGKNG